MVRARSCEHARGSAAQRRVVATLFQAARHPGCSAPRDSRARSAEAGLPSASSARSHRADFGIHRPEIEVDLGIVGARSCSARWRARSAPSARLALRSSSMPRCDVRARVPDRSSSARRSAASAASQLAVPQVQRTADDDCTAVDSGAQRDGAFELRACRRRYVAAQHLQPAEFDAAAPVRRVERAASARSSASASTAAPRRRNSGAERSKCSVAAALEERASPSRTASARAPRRTERRRAPPAAPRVLGPP